MQDVYSRLSGGKMDSDIELQKAFGYVFLVTLVSDILFGFSDNQSKEVEQDLLSCYDALPPEIQEQMEEVCHGYIENSVLDNIPWRLYQINKKTLNLFQSGKMAGWKPKNVVRLAVHENGITEIEIKNEEYGFLLHASGGFQQVARKAKFNSEIVLGEFAGMLYKNAIADKKAKKHIRQIRKGFKKDLSASLFAVPDNNSQVIINRIQDLLRMTEYSEDIASLTAHVGRVLAEFVFVKICLLNGELSYGKFWGDPFHWDSDDTDLVVIDKNEKCQDEAEIDSWLQYAFEALMESEPADTVPIRKWMGSVDKDLFSNFMGCYTCGSKIASLLDFLHEDYSEFIEDKDLNKEYISFEYFRLWKFKKLASYNLDTLRETFSEVEKHDEIFDISKENLLSWVFEKNDPYGKMIRDSMGGLHGN